MNNVHELPTVDLAIRCARSIHGAAVAMRTKVQARLAAATEALQEATEARAAMVASLAAGAPLDRPAAAAIDIRLTGAAAEVALLQEALAPLDAEVAAASENVAVFLAMEDYEAFQARIERRIAAAEAVDAACVALAAAHAEWLATGDDLLGNWPQRTRIQQHELEFVQDPAYIGRRVPPALQRIVLQSGSVNSIPSLAEKERGTWQHHLAQPAPAKAA